MECRRTLAKNMTVTIVLVATEPKVRSLFALATEFVLGKSYFLIYPKREIRANKKQVNAQRSLHLQPAFMV